MLREIRKYKQITHYTTQITTLHLQIIINTKSRFYFLFNMNCGLFVAI